MYGTVKKGSKESMMKNNDICVYRRNIMKPNALYAKFKMIR